MNSGNKSANSSYILNELSVFKWLKCGIISLAIAGLYSIILVILRTPALNHLLSNPGIFKTALVIHVNLSVLVWLLSITAAIWSYNLRNPNFGKVCARLVLASLIIIGISPFFGQNPVMNNYIPMLENIVFIVGLSLFGVVMLLLAINVILEVLPINLLLEKEYHIIQTGAYTSALMFIGAFGCFTLSAIELDKVMEVVPIDADFYYELLYWSGGHSLQFIYTQILMVSWVILFKHLMATDIKYKSAHVCLLLLNFFISLLIFGGHIYYEIFTAEFKEYFTNHMKYGAGIAPVLCLLLLVYEYYLGSRLDDKIIRASIICSSLVFMSGGFIGLMISGVNTSIPAHYHGSIVGISIAFMGLTYHYLLNKKTLWGMRFATRQIYIITVGQILHISGLAYAGDYGILRKSTNMEMAYKAKLALGLMGGGGLLAIIGGLMFVVICGKNLFFNRDYQFAKAN